MRLQILLCAFFLNTFIDAAQQEPLSVQHAPLLQDSQYGTEELLSLHRGLVEIESITENERDVGKWLMQYLQSNNFSVEAQEVSPKRFNVLAWAGEKKYTDVLVTSHIDTVPPFWPYERLSNGTIRGRGTVDAKGSVAAQIIALLSLLSPSSSSSSTTISSDAVSLLYVVGEETGGDGMRHFSAHSTHNYTSVIFGEPTESKLVSGHKGMLGFRIKVRGKAAHSGYPWLGVSANEVLVQALAALMDLQKRLPGSEKYGETTLNIGRMQGGVAANVVAEEAEANIAVRLAGGTPEEVKNLILREMENIKEQVEEHGGGLEVLWTNEGYAPVDMSCDVAGFDCITVNYGTDVPNLAGPHKRYLYGPGSIFVAHSDHEALTVHDLEGAVADYKTLILAAVEDSQREKAGLDI